VSGARSTTVLARRSGRRQLGLFTLAYLTYFGVRAATQGSVARATSDALDLMRLERAIGIDVEGSVQALISGSRTLVAAANGLYIWGHWPLLIVGGVLLFRLAPEHYYRLRDVCLLSGALGLIVFALFPVAPPRLAPSGLEDTIAVQAPAYRTILPAWLVNQYAAMPSFHAGWNLVLGVELFRATSRLALRAFAVAMPILMSFAVVATANHYVLDVLAGALVVTVALLAQSRLERRRPAARRRFPQATARKEPTCPPRSRPATPATGWKSPCPGAGHRGEARSSKSWEARGTSTTSCTGRTSTGRSTTRPMAPASSRPRASRTPTPPPTERPAATSGPTERSGSAGKPRHTRGFP
jgi:hypothetical protein